MVCLLLDIVARRLSKLSPAEALTVSVTRKHGPRPVDKCRDSKFPLLMWGTHIRAGLVQGNVCVEDFYHIVEPDSLFSNPLYLNRHAFSSNYLNTFPSLIDITYHAH